MSAMEELELAAQKCKVALSDSLRSYEQLLAKYEALEETVAAHELDNSARAGPGENRSYIMVLINCHTHDFTGDLVADATRSGAAAAIAMETEVTQYLQQYLPEHSQSRIAARVYADFEKVAKSKATTKANSVEMLEQLKRFAAGFSAERAVFDFIDLGNKKAVENKISSLFEWDVKNPSCKHIFLGGDGHKWFRRMVLSYDRFFDKLTMIQGGVDDLLKDVGLQIAKFTSIEFTAGEVDSSEKAPNKTNPGPNNLRQLQLAGLKHSFKNNRYIAFASTNHHVTNMMSSPTEIQLQRSGSTDPPLAPRSGLIPVNAAGHRLDTTLRLPTKADFAAYKSRTRQDTPCKNIHLLQSCLTRGCTYDHSPISPSMLKVLRIKWRGSPCHYKGACRLENCPHGHACYRKECMDELKFGCKLGASEHIVDKRASKWVEPVVDQEKRSTKKEIKIMSKKISCGSKDTMETLAATPAEKSVAEEKVKKVDHAEMSRVKSSVKSWPVMVGDLIDI